jgi:hypothetical protein
LQGRRVDWGAVAVLVTQYDVMEFLAACYGDDGIPGELWRVAVSLKSDGRYALIASEV